MEVLAGNGSEVSAELSLVEKDRAAMKAAFGEIVAREPMIYFGSRRDSVIGRGGFVRNGEELEMSYRVWQEYRYRDGVPLFIVARVGLVKDGMNEGGQVDERLENTMLRENELAAGAFTFYQHRGGFGKSRMENKVEVAKNMRGQGLGGDLLRLSDLVVGDVFERRCRVGFEEDEMVGEMWPTLWLALNRFRGRGGWWRTLEQVGNELGYSKDRKGTWRKKYVRVREE